MIISEKMYELISELVGMVKIYEEQVGGNKPQGHLFSQWLSDYYRKNGHDASDEPEWVGKSKGRSADSVINTSLVHLYRYAKLQAKAAIVGTQFSTPDDFIYLISLDSFGSMTKSSLIKLNVHEKSAGIQIVNRLINNGLVEQSATEGDKRNRMIHLTAKGKELLNQSRQNIKKASMNVTEPLSHQEKLDLIILLTKLETHHELKSGGKL